MWKALAILFLLCLAPTPAYAYLDPGTGSMILQLILGGVGGLVVLMKLYWHRVAQFFGRHPQEPTSTPSASD